MIHDNTDIGIYNTETGEYRSVGRKWPDMERVRNYVRNNKYLDDGTWIVVEELEEVER